MNKRLDKKLIIKSVALIVVVLIIVGATILTIPWINELKTAEGRKALQLYIESKKTVGIFIFIGFQAFQVLLPIIPPIQIIGGALFGTIWGSIYSFIGLYLGMSIVYGLVRIVGYPIVEAFVSKKDLKRFKFLQDPDKVALIFFFIYLIPGMPKDTVSFFAPLTDMKKKTYFLYVIPARFPLLFLSAVFGSAISKGNFNLVAILSIIMIDIGIIGFIFRDKVINYFEKKSKSKKHLRHNNELKHNQNMRKTGLILIISSVFLTIGDLIFMATDYFSRCSGDYNTLHNLHGKNQIIYFISSYGFYWFVSVATIGVVAYFVSLKKKKNQNKDLGLTE